MAHGPRHGRTCIEILHALPPLIPIAMSPAIVAEFVLELAAGSRPAAADVGIVFMLMLELELLEPVTMFMLALIRTIVEVTRRLQVVDVYLGIRTTHFIHHANTIVLIYTRPSRGDQGTNIACLHRSKELPQLRH